VLGLMIARHESCSVSPAARCDHNCIIAVRAGVAVALESGVKYVLQFVFALLAINTFFAYKVRHQSRLGHHTNPSKSLPNDFGYAREVSPKRHDEGGGMLTFRVFVRHHRAATPTRPCATATSTDSTRYETQAATDA
jgi:hypothetical protein